MKGTTFLILLVILFSCSKEPDITLDPSEKFKECNDFLYRCNSTGDYCLFGFKWGEQNNFSSRGINVEGPKVKGGLVSYSFQTKQNVVSTHRQIDVPTESLDQLPACARENIQKAFTDWSNVANIQLEELPFDSESDIKIFVADVDTNGNGFPNFVTSLCQQIAGHIILSTNYTTDCELFYAYTLHEIGHALGLGHSSPENIMGSIRNNLDGLKNGDIQGIREIYGE